MTKPNMSLKKIPMPSQEPQVRAHNFNEVATGYTEEMALDEALRCLSCKNMPCVSGCPVNIHIPEFIRRSRKGFEGPTRSIARPLPCPRLRPRLPAGTRANRSACAASRRACRIGR